MTDELTFVMTDVESSTVLWERHPDEMSRALVRHDEIIGAAIEAHGGTLVRDRGEGDSTFSVFESPAAAAGAAASFVRSLAGEPWSPRTPLRVRVAVYTGPAELRDGDYYGTTVNRAARTRSLAFGGQVLLGSRTAAAVADHLPEMTALVDLGPRPLRDLTEPEHVFELRLLDADAPPEPLSDKDSSNLRWADRSTWPGFVDRETERGALGGAWDAATSGGCILALVEGEAGIGKTALAAELARNATAGGGLVLYGRWDEDVLAPFQAFREALDAYARTCPRSILRADLREHAGEIARLFPEIATRIEAVASTSVADGEAERLRQFEAVEVWLEAITSRRPVLLVLDDLHWADRPSILLLRHLVRSPRDLSLLVLATFRGGDVDRGELGSLLPELSRDSDVRRLSLAGLGEEHVADLVGRVSGRRVDGDMLDVARKLHTETAGNPLFLREMVLPISDAGAFDVRSLEELALPDSVRELVRWRVRQLPADARRALATASVIGQEFELDVLAKTCGEQIEDVAVTLQHACRAGVVHESGLLGAGFAFSHAIVRRALVEDLTGAQRVRLHWAIGEVLEQREPPATPAELAHHFCAAVSTDRAAKAIRYARAAGDRAMADLAFETAVHLYGQALEVQSVQRPEDGVLHCQLLLALADAHDRAGEYAARDERYLEAAAHARRLKRTDLFTRAALGYGGVLPAATEPDERRQSLLEEALGLLGEDDTRERALVLGRLAHSLELVPPRVRRLALADEAVSIARRLGDPEDLAKVLVSRCWAMDAPEDMHEQLRVADEIRALGEQVASREIVLRALHCRNDALFESADFDALRASVDEMRELAGELRYPEYTRITRTWEAVFAAIEGRYDEAVGIADEVRDVLRVMGHPQSELVHTAVTFPIHWMRGTLIDGLPLYEALALQFPERLLFPMIVAWCTAEAGMTARARAALDAIPMQAVAGAEGNYMWWSLAVGLSCAATALGDRDWAALLYGLMSPYPDRYCTMGSSSFAGTSSHHLGALATALGHLDDAERHFEDALVRHDAMGARPFLALTQACYAGMLLARDGTGDRDRGRELEDAALAAADELGLEAVRYRVGLRSS